MVTDRNLLQETLSGIRNEVETNLYTNFLAPLQHHVSIQCGKTCLSGPVPDDKGRHTQADDEVGIDDELQAWFFM